MYARTRGSDHSFGRIRIAAIALLIMSAGACGANQLNADSQVIGKTPAVAHERFPSVMLREIEAHPQVLATFSGEEWAMLARNANVKQRGEIPYAIAHFAPRYQSTFVAEVEATAKDTPALGEEVFLEYRTGVRGEPMTRDAAGTWGSLYMAWQFGQGIGQSVYSMLSPDTQAQIGAAINAQLHGSNPNVATFYGIPYVDQTGAQGMNGIFSRDPEQNSGDPLGGDVGIDGSGSCATGDGCKH